MKSLSVSTIAAASVLSSVHACEQSDVSVCMDATYTLDVPENDLCSGPSNQDPHGTVCPQKGDVASADCYKYLNSYDEYEKKCIAPEDAQCQKIYTGAWGCVFPSVGCHKTDEPTTTTTTKKPCTTTTTTTTTTKKPCTTTPAPTSETSDVSVCMDATYTLDVPEDDLCSGPSDQDPHGTVCPQKGDVASADCYKYLNSYDEYEKKCIAPEDAQCQKIYTGAWGCVFPSVGCKDTAEPTTTTKKPCTTTTTTKKPCTTTPAPTSETSDVSVCMDATYTLDVPEDDLCSGPSDQDPHGTVCPQKGDVASADCHKYLKSYDEYEKKCIAPEDAQCQKIYTGAWGCVFPSVGCKDTAEPTTTTKKPCTTTPAPTSETSDVSVCMDATYALDVPEDDLCSGPSDQDPHGTVCPQKGDVASADCHKYLTSYDEYETKCIAPEDAQCQKIYTGAWGCVFPSVGCNSTTEEPTTSTKKPCTTTPAPTSEPTDTPTSTDVSSTSTEMPTSTTSNSSETTPTPTVSQNTKSDGSNGASHIMVSLATVIGVVVPTILSLL